jgi:hypothetical protein
MTAPPLISPHKDGWRMKHLEAFARDNAFATIMSSFITNISIGDNPFTNADYVASSTLVALMKKNEEKI